MSQKIKLPLSDSVEIIQANQHGLVALNKDVGVLSHPNSEKEKKVSILKASFNFKEEFFYWENTEGILQKAWLVNRLDSPTSGVILLALNQELKQSLRRSFETHSVRKIYYAIVKGCPKFKAGLWDGKTMPKGSNSKHNKELQVSKTKFTVESTSNQSPKLSLLKLEPLTGRTHQIRIQCAQFGQPIIGDQTYGDFKFNRLLKKNTGIARLMLHCHATELKYYFKGRTYKFSAKVALPEEFEKLTQD